MCARLIRAADAGLSSAPEFSTDGYPSVAAALMRKAPGPKSRARARMAWGSRTATYPQGPGFGA